MTTCYSDLGPRPPHGLINDQEKRLAHLLSRAESELREATIAVLSPARRDLLTASDWHSLGYLCDQISLLRTDLAEQRIIVEGTSSS